MLKVQTKTSNIAILLEANKVCVKKGQNLICKVENEQYGMLHVSEVCNQKITKKKAAKLRKCKIAMSSKENLQYHKLNQKERKNETKLLKANTVSLKGGIIQPMKRNTTNS